MTSEEPNFTKSINKPSKQLLFFWLLSVRTEPHRFVSSRTLSSSRETMRVDGDGDGWSGRPSPNSSRAGWHEEDWRVKRFLRVQSATFTQLSRCMTLLQLQLHRKVEATSANHLLTGLRYPVTFRMSSHVSLHARAPTRRNNGWNTSYLLTIDPFPSRADLQEDSVN